MLESGYYPPGAENDPRAPWNETDDDAGPIDEEMCSDCEWPSDECKCDDEDKHDEFCGVNRVFPTKCDCWVDS